MTSILNGEVYDKNCIEIYDFNANGNKLKKWL